MGNITRSRQSKQGNPETTEYSVVDESHEDKPFYIPWQLDDMPLSDAEFRVYFHIRRIGWKSGACWRTITHLANELGKKRHTVIAALARLVELRMLRRDDFIGHKQRTVYRILPIRSWAVKPVSQRAPVRSQNDEPVSEGAPEPVSQRAPVQSYRKGSETEESNPPNGGCEAPSGARATSHDPTPGSLVWKEYSEGMKRRWRTSPPRNAKTASICKQLVEAVGIDNAMALARAYPERVDKWYVEKGHPIGLLLSDYPKLLRDLSLGFKITKSMAESLESTYDGAQAIGLAKSGIMPCAIGEHDSVNALPAHDEPLF